MSQIRKSHAAKGFPCFAKIAYISWPSPLEYMVDMSWPQSHDMGTPWGCPPWAIGCSCFTFCCTTYLSAKRGPEMSQCASSPSLPASLLEMLGSSGPQASYLFGHFFFALLNQLKIYQSTLFVFSKNQILILLTFLFFVVAVVSSNANMCCSSSSKHLCTLCTGAASQTALFIFAFKGVKKIHPTVPVAVPATLFRKWERTACNTFSILSGEPSTASQSSTGAHTKKIAATWYHMLYGGHWLPPSSGACWVSCRLGQLQCSSSCPRHQLSSCISLCTLFVESVIDKVQAKSLEEDLRSHRNDRQVYSLVADAAAIA